MASDENKKRNSGCLWRLLAALLIPVVFVLIPIMKEGPTFWVAKNPPDTELYLPSDERITISNTDKWAIGSHVRIIGKLPSPDQNKWKGSYRYFPLLNYYTDQSFCLLSEEELPTGPVKIDGMVVGYVLAENKLKMKVYCPVLRVTDCAETDQTYMDVVAPVQSEEEPGQSVTEADVLLTLDRIEYRGTISRVFFTVSNLSEEEIRLTDMEFLREGESIGGTLVVNRYVPDARTTRYQEDTPNVYPALSMAPGESSSAEITLAAIEPEQQLEMCLKYARMVAEEVLNDNTQYVELRLRYPPDDPEETGEQSK